MHRIHDSSDGTHASTLQRDVFSFTTPSGVDSFNSTIRMKLHNIKDKYRIASVSIVAG